MVRFGGFDFRCLGANGEHRSITTEFFKCWLKAGNQKARPIRDALFAATH